MLLPMGNYKTLLTCHCHSLTLPFLLILVTLAMCCEGSLFSKHCVYKDGDYMGSYLITERIQVVWEPLRKVLAVRTEIVLTDP